MGLRLRKEGSGKWKEKEQAVKGVKELLGGEWKGRRDGGKIDRGKQGRQPRKKLQEEV